MKTRKYFTIIALVSVIVLFSACNKCHECHYDKAGAEVELGEYCNENLEEVEANGYTDSTGTYEVHCHEH
ncbi:MAG: hypothetical protein IPM74_14720 [Crocinitomicaceae bacterium]|nr:hypothetical protein [Crocinitomicaceae bacterium]MBK8927124.1 hypothetical protein [Crocinitomicaceae bacterium]